MCMCNTCVKLPLVGGRGFKFPETGATGNVGALNQTPSVQEQLVFLDAKLYPGSQLPVIEPLGDFNSL